MSGKYVHVHMFCESHSKCADLASTNLYLVGVPEIDAMYMFVFASVTGVAMTCLLFSLFICMCEYIHVCDVFTMASQSAGN